MTLIYGATYGQEWRVSSRSDGIMGYTRQSSPPLLEVRATGTITSPLPVIESLLRDIPAEKRFGFCCAEAYRINIPGVKSSPDVFPIYYRMDLPYPVKDRDVIWLVQFFYDPATGVLRADLHALDTDYGVSKGVVRMRKGYATFVLTPLERDRTGIDYTSQCDPGGSLPSFLINMILKDFAPSTIAGIRKAARDRQYQAADRVLTRTPMP